MVRERWLPEDVLSLWIECDSDWAQCTKYTKKGRKGRWRTVFFRSFWNYNCWDIYAIINDELYHHQHISLINLSSFFFTRKEIEVYTVWQNISFMNYILHSTVKSLLISRCRCTLSSCCWTHSIKMLHYPSICRNLIIHRLVMSSIEQSLSPLISWYLGRKLHLRLGNFRVLILRLEMISCNGMSKIRSLIKFRFSVGRC